MLLENRLKSNMKISIFYECGSLENLVFNLHVTTSLERLFMEAAFSI
jgi:hypothetical protein